jgi:phenylalanine-4-hydroxylase
MAVGERVSSVFAGAADKARFEAHIYRPSDMDLPQHPIGEDEQRLQALYGQVRGLREAPPAPEALEGALTEVVSALESGFPQDWLLRLEVLELLQTQRLNAPLQARLRETLTALKTDAGMHELIENGLSLLS